MGGLSVNFNGLDIVEPGAYSKISVQLNGGAPLSPAGVVAIIGESLGGAPGVTDGVQTFDSTQLSDLVAKYVSGPIVDAARALIAPSKDPDIVNGANQIRVYKTNNSAKATGVAKEMDDAVTPGNVFTLESINYGKDEDNDNFYLTEGTMIDEHSAFTSGSITFPVTCTPAGGLVYRFGGVNYVFTIPGAGPYTQAQLIAALNDNANWLPSRPCVTTDVGTDKIKIQLDTSLPAFDGYESMHEYGFAFLGGVDCDEELKFRTKVLWLTNGTSGGTFTIAADPATVGLAVNMWTQIIDNDSGSLFVKITNISGTGPYTIELNDGAIDLSSYTTAQQARIWGSCSIIDPMTLEFTAGTGGWSRGVRGSRMFFDKRNTYTETIPENANSELFRIMYKGAGSACVMSIQDVATIKKLTTTVTGASGDNLDIIISNYTTIQMLVDYINNFGGGTKYQCYSDYFNASTFNPISLDYYNAIDIKSMPLPVKAAKYELQQNLLASSQIMNATITSNIYGQLALVSSTNRTFLSGGSNGYTSNSMIQAGFDALLAEDCNFVVPLFSQDALTDIADGLTDPLSTYTITSINAMLDSHCRVASNTENKSERQGYVALKDTYVNTKAAAKLMNSEFTSMVFQDSMVLDNDGTVRWKNPHITACLFAGMEAGAPIPLPITKKAVNCYGVRHAEFNPRTQTSDAIRNGLTFAKMPPKGGVIIAVGNTTYMRDQSFVWNRRSTMRCAFYTVRYLRDNTEAAFVGKSNLGGDTLANGIKSYVQTLLNSLRVDGILAGDSKNGGLGYYAKTLAVNINANVVKFSVTITCATGIDFVLEDITLAALNDNA